MQRLGNNPLYLKKTYYTPLSLRVSVFKYIKNHEKEF